MVSYFSTPGGAAGGDLSGTYPNPVVSAASAGLTVTGAETVSTNLVVGTATALGDNGVGELQIGNVTTVPTTNPTAGVTLYAQSGAETPLKLRDPTGLVRSVVDGYATATADQTTTSATQVASTYLILTIGANSVHLIEAGIIGGVTSGNYVMSWTGPAGATLKWGSTDTPANYQATIGGTISLAAGGGGAQLSVLKGKLTTGATGGAFTFTFSSSAGGTATTYADSWIRATRVA